MNNPKRFVIVSDIHGEEQDARACAAAIAFTRDFKPDIKVIAGDLWNFAAIRRGADDKDRSKSMKADFSSGVDFGNRFFAGGGVNHFLLGNHDVRPWDMMGEPCGKTNDLGERMVDDIRAFARKNRARMYPYDSRAGVLKIGHLSVIHGFHTGANACATHSRIYGNVVFGHGHSIESYQTPGLKQQEARCIGCLCKLDQPYADRKTGKLRWAHGWAYGWVFPDGTYQIHQARDIGGVFHASTSIAAY